MATNIFTTANAEAFKAATAAEREAEKALRAAQSAHLAARARVAFIRALYEDEFSHSRVETFKGQPSTVYLYRRDATSPSGVVCSGALNYAEAQELMARK